ncbi:MAG: DUF362 domain-containing protein [Desulforhopalus sp.]|nr:DUF362 domain-containing protein [Desulforhopalus sp.]
MSDSITRRTFIKGSTAFGVSSILGGGIDGWIHRPALAAATADIVVVQGADYFQSAMRAVELLGGMGRFVAKGARVGLLINSPWDNPGSYVRPDIVLAVLRMCREAGAKEIGVFKELSSSYWKRSPLAAKFADDIKSITTIGGDHMEVAIPRGKTLKKADVAKALLECDVFINIPIAKDHSGLGFTGTLKNMMGLTSFATNMYFHHGSGKLGWYDDVDFLAQCIADINLLRRPDLCIFDGTEILATNGPRGPGKLVKPQKVFAGVDRVALDVYGANLLGIKGDEVRTAQLAHEHGLGEIDLTRLRIEEVMA